MTDTEAARWTEVRELFELVCDRTADEREALLAARGASDPELVREVRALLEGDTVASSALDKSGGELHLEGLRAEERRSLIGLVLDGYRLTSVLGEGGTATVYLAEVMGERDAHVAVKILKSEHDSGGSAGRFRDERFALSGMTHPGLIEIRDAGELEDGRPYLVTDHVDGAPIDAYCDAHHLGRSERLRLFVEVCGAVHHAHRHLVVHRDLKPSNILVTADGRPKVLDFGIAKLLDAERDPDWTDLYGRSPFTPSYASPEQIRGEPVTTATDVYSLGVLLFRLVTGQSPYRPAEGGRAALERAVLDAPPSSPRDAARETGRGEVPADLVTILGVALRKDPGERYPSVEHFADDVRRFLEHRPLRARRERPWVRVVRFVRRQPFAAAGAVGLVSLLGGGWLGAQRNLERVRASESIAWRAHANAARATNLLADLLEQVGDQEATAAHDLARLLNDAELDLARLENSPEAECRLRIALGRVERRIGRPAAAEAHLRRALFLSRDTRGVSWRETDRCLEILAELCVDRDDAEALALATERVELVEANDSGTKAVQSARSQLERMRAAFSARSP